MRCEDFPCCGHTYEDPCPWTCRDCGAETTRECVCEDAYAERDQYTDVEADANTLASAGWGTDEDYGYYGDDFDY